MRTFRSRDATVVLLELSVRALTANVIEGSPASLARWRLARLDAEMARSKGAVLVPDRAALDRVGERGLPPEECRAEIRWHAGAERRRVTLVFFEEHDADPFERLGALLAETTLATKGVPDPEDA